jgi:hypothetical protein
MLHTNAAEERYQALVYLVENSWLPATQLLLCLLQRWQKGHAAWQKGHAAWPPPHRQKHLVGCEAHRQQHLVGCEAHRQQRRLVRLAQQCLAGGAAQQKVPVLPVLLLLRG